MPRSKVGSITKTKEGRYLVRVRHGYRRDGSVRCLSKVVDTAYQAEQARNALCVQLGISRNAGDEITLATYYHTYFLPGRKRYLTNATIMDYDLHWRRHIADAFGHMPMSAIKHGMVQSLIDGMTRPTAEHCVRTLRAILRSAWDDDFLDAEPMRKRFRYPPAISTPRVLWTAAETTRAIPVLSGHPLESLFLVLLGGGLRRSEGLALSWGDFKFSASSNYTIAIVDVTEAVTVQDGRKSAKNKFSRRRIVIGEPFSSRLKTLAGKASEPICSVNPRSIPNIWKRLWEVPSDNGKDHYAGAMCDANVPYLPIGTMRAVHETLHQRAGLLDTINSRMHGRTNVATGYRHYLSPDIDAYTTAAVGMSKLLR